MAASKKRPPTKRPAVRTKRAPKKGTRQKSAADWADRFLAALSSCGNITHACTLAGVGRTTFYERRDSDERFKAAVKDAFIEATDSLELEARRRAMDGWDEPVHYKGEATGTVRKFSDTLLIFLLKAHRPKRFRERFVVKHKGRVKTGTVVDLTDEELAAIIAGKEAASANPAA